jgi:hypothetical protein
MTTQTNTRRTLTTEDFLGNIHLKVELTPSLKANGWNEDNACLEYVVNERRRKISLVLYDLENGDYTVLRDTYYCDSLNGEIEFSDAQDIAFLNARKRVIEKHVKFIKK